jgi:hypothetical protein
MRGFPKLGKSLQWSAWPAINAYKDGELLAWLCQYRFGNVFLKKGIKRNVFTFYKLTEVTTNDHQEGFIIDFPKLEGYKYKEDYEPYGDVMVF